MSEKVVELATERIPLLEVFKGADVDALMADIEDDGMRDADPSLLNIVRKASAFAETKSEFEPGERAMIAYISTGAIDRDFEVLRPKGADLSYFRKNPVVLYGHDYSSLPVGRAAWLKQDDHGIKAKTVFSSSYDFAEKVWGLYLEKILRTVSVGFLPVKSHVPEADEFEGAERVRRVYDKWILLEYSCVPVPSNYEALVTAVAKGLVLGDRLSKDLGLTKGKDAPTDHGDPRWADLDERLAQIEQHVLTLMTPKTMPAPAGIYVTASPKMLPKPVISAVEANKIALSVATQVLAQHELARAKHIKDAVALAFGHVVEL